LLIKIRLHESTVGKAPTSAASTFDIPSAAQNHSNGPFDVSVSLQNFDSGVTGGPRMGIGAGDPFSISGGVGSFEATAAKPTVSMSTFRNDLSIGVSP
jgi:hypothetical protein